MSSKEIRIFLNWKKKHYKGKNTLMRYSKWKDILELTVK